MKVQVKLLSHDRVIEHKDVHTATSEDGLYSLLLSNGETKRYPLVNIFDITETP